MYSFSYLEPVCCSMSSFNSCFLTCIQVSQEAHQVVWYSHLFQNFPQFIVIHTVKGFGIVNNLGSILKSRDITLPIKDCLVKAIVFPAVMYGCESWTVKKAEHWKIDAFELWCWRRPQLRVPWTAGRSNQSILKEISPGCSLEGLMLKLKLEYFGHLVGRVDSLEKTFCWEGWRAGGEGDDRVWDGWMASPTQWTYEFE